ncbi:uncharacterized protein BJ171DRAFT_509922 [Polychytrium aggregatum]|uniref:uncharacterized protein n=1 Tax=Polychytrium aggregatum TaxID=110093 RepID=UPI0022FF422C|nr:uncharacterized protein BJ171DRAFT_509922 [Polychytrium aggregatum]KAI9203547.1 hypothetical protein BJ171DRAFT_509922 [Polychytrium aggregatum]
MGSDGMGWDRIGSDHVQPSTIDVDIIELALDARSVAALGTIGGHNLVAFMKWHLLCTSPYPFARNASLFLTPYWETSFFRLASRSLRLVRCVVSIYVFLLSNQSCLNSCITRSGASADIRTNSCASDPICQSYSSSSSSLLLSSSLQCRRSDYILELVQHPLRARCCGLGQKANYRPIDPAPILKGLTRNPPDMKRTSITSSTPSC